MGDLLFIFLMLGVPMIVLGLVACVLISAACADIREEVRRRIREGRL